MKLMYKINKSSSNSVAKIIENKLGGLLIRRMALALKSIKKHHQNKAKKQMLACELAACVHRILEKKNQVFTIFYQLKHKRKDQGSMYMI